MGKGMMLVLSGPSGVGKGRLKKLLLERLEGFYSSVSYTVRAIREGEETHGVDYYFVTRDTFLEMDARGEFLETALVHDHLYGTPLVPAMEAMERGLDVLLEIDCQGALQVHQKIPGCILIFIVPPSFGELERRLRSRGTEKEAEIHRRLQNAHQEIATLKEYHYVLVNDELESAYEKLSSIIIAERHRTTRYCPIVL